MSVATILLVVGLALACVTEVQAQGRSLLGWAVILIAGALLLPLL